MPPLTPLSDWMRRYVIAFGAWMDEPGSIDEEAVKSYYNSPRYNMGDYDMPMGGWKTFNQFFARYTKPGYRPVAAINDDHVITSPADSTNDGQWEINAESKVNIKGLEWSIEEAPGRLALQRLLRRRHLHPPVPQHHRLSPRACSRRRQSA